MTANYRCSSSNGHLSAMPFSSIFRRKNEPSVSLVSRTPSLLRRRSTKSSVKQNDHMGSMSANSSPVAPQPDSQRGNTASHVTTNPQRGSSSFDPPPAYTPSDIQASQAPNRNSNVSAANKISTTTDDDPYASLSTFDTVFLIDDSGSMAGRSWKETSEALAAIAPICAAHDNDGVDVVFMNTKRKDSHRNLKTARDIHRVFSSTKPGGATPTGITLDSILRPYLEECQSKGVERVKPLNVIVITDGVPTDDPETVIVDAAKWLERLNAPGRQVGIQFFQVGSEPGAAEGLRELDDGLVELGCPRDIVDTVPWKGQLSAQGILKVVLGAVNKRLDRRRNSGESQR